MTTPHSIIRLSRDDSPENNEDFAGLADKGTANSGFLKIYFDQRDLSKITIYKNLKKVARQP
jgi:hypothetical protein